MDWEEKLVELEVEARCGDGTARILQREWEPEFGHCDCSGCKSRAYWVVFVHQTFLDAPELRRLCTFHRDAYARQVAPGWVHWKARDRDRKARRRNGDG